MAELPDIFQENPITTYILFPKKNLWAEGDHQDLSAAVV